MPPLAWCFVSISNLTLLGQDQVMFMSVRDSNLRYPGDFANSEVQLWQGLLIPPAWSLSIELTFYLIAPFILESRKKIVLFFSLSLSLRAVFALLGFGMNDPWSYRFFPTELALFLAGAISHQIIAPRVFSLARSHLNLTSYIVVALSIATVVIFPAVQLTEAPKNLLLFGFLLFALPFLFRHQTESKLDSFLGRLSYPIYIWHWLVISVVTTIYLDIEREEPRLIFAVLAATFALSWLSVLFVENPIEKLRKTYRSKEI